MATKHSSSEAVIEPQTKKSKTTRCAKQVTDDTKSLIKENFLVTMPQDFYDFWEFMYDLDEAHPGSALHPYHLRLAGPFDVLLGKSSEDDNDYFLHHRFYYDCPEFQTLLISTRKNDLYHIGYYRDCPTEEPVFVASNNADKGCALTILADNLFAALHSHLQQEEYSSSSKKLRQKIEKVMEVKGYDLGRRTAKIKAREKKVVSKGFHGAGIVVPVDENEVGWREVPMTIGELKKLFGSIVKKDKNSDKSADELQELITYVQFANDECDYGQGLELGNDLFCFGEDTLHGYIKALLPMAYSLLGYTQFETIVLAHLDKRIKACPSYLT